MVQTVATPSLICVKTNANIEAQFKQFSYLFSKFSNADWREQAHYWGALESLSLQVRSSHLSIWQHQTLESSELSLQTYPPSVLIPTSLGLLWGLHSISHLPPLPPAPRLPATHGALPHCRLACAPSGPYLRPSPFSHPFWNSHQVMSPPAPLLASPACALF